MSLARAVAFVLAQEGSDLVTDPGLSRYGIDLSRHPELTEADIRGMTAQRAALIYTKGYWDPIQGNALPEWIQLPMLDSAVNEGPVQAIRTLQRALFVAPDGKLGSQTLNAVAHADPHTTLAAFASERILDYSLLRTWPTYGKGWVRRAVLASLEAV